MKKTSYENIQDAVYDPYDPKYGELSSIENELNRTFDLCNSCRMCFKHCPSFPSLFTAMDRTEADVTLLTDQEKAKVIGECYQCRICYVVCPYTETDKHPYKIDFPALMMRAKISAVKKKGIRLRERLFSNPDLLGRLNSGWVSILVNWGMKNSLHRSLLHTLLGIHKKKQMPNFHRTPFSRWFRKHQKGQEKTAHTAHTAHTNTENKVVLFSTCFVNYNNPQIGKDAVEVLEKNKVTVEHPPQNCCGMPALDSGNLKSSRKKMKRNIRSLLPYAEKGYKILAINPTCSLTLKEEYKRFLPPGHWREKAQKIAEATMDLHEYLFTLKKNETFNRSFKSSPGKIAYHVPCHLRAQSIGFRSRDIMQLIPETKVDPVAECCGHDGTWAMKKEFFDMSLEAGKRAFEGLKKLDADVTATDCPLAAVQLEQGMDADKHPVHPIQILAKAYHTPEEGGHPHSIEEIKGNPKKL